MPTTMPTKEKSKKTTPTIVPTTFNKWQNSVEKSQAHNLKVVGSNPNPATNLLNKINNLDHPQRFRFLGVFCVLSLIMFTEWLTNWLTSVIFYNLTEDSKY